MPINRNSNIPALTKSQVTTYLSKLKESDLDKHYTHTDDIICTIGNPEDVKSL